MASLYQSAADTNKKSADDQIYSLDKQYNIEGQDNTWNIFGTAKPKITIVEFGDFTCHFCHEDFPIVRAMMVKYPDIVKFIWRDRVPTQRSLVLAMTAQCAGAQGKFWPMHDKLFLNQSDTLGTNAAEIIGLAEQLNLDLDTFRLCLKNQAYLSKITKSMKTSLDLGVNGTPTFFINGQKYEGVLSADNFEAIINELR